MVLGRPRSTPFRPGRLRASSCRVAPMNASSSATTMLSTSSSTRFRMPKKPQRIRSGLRRQLLTSVQNPRSSLHRGKSSVGIDITSVAKITTRELETNPQDPETPRGVLFNDRWGSTSKPRQVWQTHSFLVSIQVGIARRRRVPLSTGHLEVTKNQVDGIKSVRARVGPRRTPPSPFRLRILS